MPGGRVENEAARMTTTVKKIFADPENELRS